MTFTMEQLRPDGVWQAVTFPSGEAVEPPGLRAAEVAAKAHMLEHGVEVRIVVTVEREGA